MVESHGWNNMFKDDVKSPPEKDLDLSSLDFDRNEFDLLLEPHIEPGGLVEIAVRELGAEVVKIEVELPEAS
jgi:hypothetical protein